jgi:hypothetical protein
MKAKEKERLLYELMDKFNSDDEALFIIHATNNKSKHFGVGDMDLIHRGIYKVLEKGIEGKEGMSAAKLAWTILEAIRDLRDEGVDIEELLDAFDDDEDGCGDCELMRVCNEQDAIEYRKAHGIPRPKKGKGRKVNVN